MAGRIDGRRGSVLGYVQRAFGVLGRRERRMRWHIQHEVMLDEIREVAEVRREQRDRYVRALNRIDAAITHHQKADRFKEDHDDALYAARARVLSDLGETR